MKTIAFFNNKGGVGKTSLVYHLSWMLAEQGIPVLAADFDPQANLTSMFLEEDQLEELWPESESGRQTIYGAVEPIVRGIHDISPVRTKLIQPNLHLLPGDLALSRFEDKLSKAWPECHNRDEAAFRCTTAFYRIMDAAARASNAQVVLVDVGPNLGAINRAALIASDHVCLPLAPDLFSLQGLMNLGPTFRLWRDIWKELIPKAPGGLLLPQGGMKPVGYVVVQYGIRDSRPVKAYQRWMDRIPSTYSHAVLEQPSGTAPLTIGDDRQCLAQLKHYRSLMPLAMEHRKPMFRLTPADGAIGAHVQAVRQCREDFKMLTHRLLQRAELQTLADSIAEEAGLPG